MNCSSWKMDSSKMVQSHWKSKSRQRSQMMLFQVHRSVAHQKPLCQKFRKSSVQSAKKLSLIRTLHVFHAAICSVHRALKMRSNFGKFVQSFHAARKYHGIVCVACAWRCKYDKMALLRVNFTDHGLILNIKFEFTVQNKNKKGPKSSRVYNTSTHHSSWKSMDHRILPN